MVDSSGPDSNNPNPNEDPLRVGSRNECDELSAQAFHALREGVLTFLTFDTSVRINWRIEQLSRSAEIDNIRADSFRGGPPSMEATDEVTIATHPLELA